MLAWITDQIKNMNVLTIIIVVTIMSSLSKYNLNAEVKTLTQTIYYTKEELKDEIRSLRRKED